jgi:aspartyl-tRNA(Asn)/glutamyl-tRNA(Gln) amidotransferase subunit B
LELLARFENLCVANLNPEKVANLLINKPEYRNLYDDEFVAKVGVAEDKIEDVSELENMAREVIANNFGVVNEYKAGKLTSIEFLVGQVMKVSKGKAKADVVREILRNLLQ